MNTCKKILGYFDRTDERSHYMDRLTPRRSPSSAPLLCTQQCDARGPLGSSIFVSDQ